MTRILLWLQKLWMQVSELFCSTLGKQPWCSTVCGVHICSCAVFMCIWSLTCLKKAAQWLCLVIFSEGALQGTCFAMPFFFCSWATFGLLLLGFIFYKCKNKAFLGYLPEPPWCRTFIKTGFYLSEMNWCRSTKGYITTGLAKGSVLCQ